MSPRFIRNMMIGIVIILVIALIIFLFSPHHKRLPTAPGKHINTQGQPTIGARNAPIHIVAFEDLKCSNCMRFNTTLLPKIINHYIKPGLARYTVITLAFVPGSPPAANAALCVRAQQPTAFFDYVKKIYDNQPPENENWATIPKLMAFAQGIKGINLNKLADCLVQNRFENQLTKNLALAGNVMGKQQIATPSIFINGRQVTPLTWSQLQRAIKQAHH